MHGYVLLFFISILFLVAVGFLTAPTAPDFQTYHCCLELFAGESCNPDGSIAMVKWETPEGEVNDVPCVYFFIDGLKEEKVVS